MKADYPRGTHPCATLLRTEVPFAFDLHVLGTPPAFNLSQNQTLQFKSFALVLNDSSKSQSLTKTISWLHQFFPTRYSLVKEPLGAEAPRCFTQRGAGLCPIRSLVSTTFFQPRKLFPAAPAARRLRPARWGICPISPPPSTTFFQFGIFFATLPCPAVLPQRRGRNLHQLASIVNSFLLPPPLFPQNTHRPTRLSPHEK